MSSASQISPEVSLSCHPQVIYTSSAGHLHIICHEISTPKYFQSKSRTALLKMLPPSGQLLSKSECRNLGHDLGKQDGRSATQCFEAFLVKFFGWTLVLSVGLLIPLFWTSGDICPVFQSQGGRPCVCALSPVCNGFFRNTSGVTPADFLAAELFQFTYLHKSIGGARSGIERAL